MYTTPFLNFENFQLKLANKNFNETFEYTSIYLFGRLTI